MSISRYEQETIINFNAEESTASIYTADPNMIKRLDKLCIKSPNSYKVTEQDQYSKTYEISSKKLITLRTPSTRVYTEEEKQMLRDRLNKVRKK